MAGGRAVVSRRTVPYKQKVNDCQEIQGLAEKIEIRVDYRRMKFGTGPAVKDWKKGLGTAEVSPNENGPATFAQQFAPVREVKLPYRPARPVFSQYAWDKR